jgi:hypothetical protein
MISRVDPIQPEKRRQESIRLALLTMPLCLAATQPRAAEAAQLLLWHPCERLSTDKMNTMQASRKGFLHALRRFLPTAGKGARRDSHEDVAVAPFGPDLNILVDEPRLND